MSILGLMENKMDTGQTTPNLSAVPVDPPPQWPGLLVVLVLVVALGYWLHRRHDHARAPSQGVSPNKWEWGIPESWKRAAPTLGFHLVSSWPVALALVIVWLER